MDWHGGVTFSVECLESLVFKQVHLFYKQINYPVSQFQLPFMAVENNSLTSNILKLNCPLNIICSGSPFRQPAV